MIGVAVGDEDRCQRLAELFDHIPEFVDVVLDLLGVDQYGLTLPIDDRRCGRGEGQAIAPDRTHQADEDS